MLSKIIIEEAVKRSLLEDAPWGDATSEHLIPADAIATAQLVAREPGVMAGGEVFAAAFTLVDASVQVKLHIADGDKFEAKQLLATVTGPARAVLTGERVGLNFVQRMAGIATHTAQYVSAVAGTGAKIVDTRKTTPGLRPFEKHAVACGGGHNHRYSLSDAVMAKDNHLAILTRGGKDLTTELRRVKSELGHTTHLEVEVDSLEQIPPVLAAGVDTIMLDNFSLENLRAGVALIGGACIIEASGGVNLNTVRAIAETGVDVISVGALTHQIHSLDLGLDIEID
ncbi:MAG: carboxylating nicotinate-nucleotide diphosphorylase [Actinomycetales bacterium]|nr:carboxylating nicotinate-nucleotide diphosphorylase [Actinomycetales bacterium]